jgi:hypothetical protein
MKTLAQQYLDMVDQYDMDREDALANVLKILERIAPAVLEDQIENIQEYISSWSE